jgi:predicted metalloprotease with PDZ domain
MACSGSVPPATQESPSGAAQASGNRLDISYRVGWTSAASHVYDIQIDIAKPHGDVVKLQMPVWSPGRYAPFYFARNVSDFTVTSNGAPVRWDRENGSLWRLYVPSASAPLTVRYHVYANTLSGTFSVLDTAHANWNGPSLFMYVVDHKPDPVRLRVDVPRGWHIVNGDARSVDQADYLFENYDRSADTPTEVTRALTLDTMRIDNRIYRAMVHHNGSVSPSQRRRFTTDLAKIVKYENTVFDPPPLEMYTFLFNIGFAGGDGMEHLYSTQCITSDPWRDQAVLPGIDIAAHEYFHVWNMKRVRAAALGPFDYTREVYQPSLWVGEGWTQYYGMVAMSRSGVEPAENIFSSATSIISSNLTAPGRKEVSARMSSFEAPFFDGSTAGFAVNPAAFYTYYFKGAGIALYLDLYIRGHSANRKSLDDAFRLLRDRTWGAPNASYYLQGRGYTEEDVVQAVSDVAGTDMHPWFDRHVGGTEDMDYDEVLAPAGMRLVREDGGASYRVEQVANATAAQRAIRAGWIAGTTIK